MKMLVSTIAGIFVLDNDRLIEHHPFDILAQYVKKDILEHELVKKYPGIKKASIPQYNDFFMSSDFKNNIKNYLPAFYRNNLAYSKKLVRESVSADNLIVHAASSIDEIDKAVNILVKRLREWYSLYLPEVSRIIEDNEKFAELVYMKTKKQLQAELKIKETMGADLKKQDLDQISSLAGSINRLYHLRKENILYLGEVMKSYCPNLLDLCGVPIAAKLLSLAGSLKRMAILPSSTIQLLGAEKALFRHLVKKTKSPKHGILLHHPIVQNVKKNEKGKAARALADKISLAARLDYFKGEAKGRKFREELEKRFGVSVSY